MLRWLGEDNPDVPLILTIPHAGETVPPEADWLREVAQDVLLTDIDRYVDLLYINAIERLPLPALMTEVHRYAADLNRYPGDIDAESVRGAPELPGRFTKGFHWVESTLGIRLIATPIANSVHEELVQKYHHPFHEAFGRRLDILKAKFPGKGIYHLDCHSMPSIGTEAHEDSGKPRAEVVISDCEGKSASTAFKDLVIGTFEGCGFEVAYNYPYKGGRITQRYGKPAQGHQTIQIELNRKIYMDEEGTRGRLSTFRDVSARLSKVLGGIVADLKLN